MKITNEMRVRIKELQLDLLGKWLKENKGNEEVKDFYKTFEDLYNELPDSIEHFKYLIEIKKMFKDQPNAPMMIGIGGSDKTIEETINRYEIAESFNPNKAPLRKEHIEIYKQVMREFSQE